jgi:hypothetical protein
MSLIKPRTRGKEFLRLVTRLERETNETLHAYAEFLGEPVEYVLNELIDTVLGKDKDFVAWRAKHPESFAPRRATDKEGKGRKPASNRRRETTPVAPSGPAAGGAAGLIS